jgi:hypothetical protein
MSLELIAAIGIILIALAIFGALMVYYQLRHQWFAQQFEDRKIRQEHYRLLIRDISEAAHRMDDDSHQALLTMLDSTVMIASPRMVLKVIEFQKFMRASNIRVLRNSQYWLEQRDELSQDLIKGLRMDAFGYETEVQEGLSEWRPLARTVRKPGEKPFEVVPLKGFLSKWVDSDIEQQK